MNQAKKNIFIVFYLIALVSANLIVKHFGAPGLWFSSALLIPFDFICRAIFHETWKGEKLVINLLLLTVVSGIVTFVINHKALDIALASFSGIVAVQVFAGIFYQMFMKKSYFFKVNLSDLIAIIVDSITFQLVAFNSVNFEVTGGQMLIKALGGLFWYYIIFKIFKFNPNERK